MWCILLFRLSYFLIKYKLCIPDGAVVGSIVAAAPGTVATFVVAASIVVWSKIVQDRLKLPTPK